VDDWVTALTPDAFIALLPLLRRTFSIFSTAERRQMAERVKQGKVGQGVATITEIDSDRAALALPLVAQLLGLELAL
jgi:hypothetical protein